MDDFLSTQAGVYSMIEKKKTPEEQERIERERVANEEKKKEEAHHRIGEVVSGLQDTSEREHRGIGVGETGEGLGGTSNIPSKKIGADFGEWVEAREKKTGIDLNRRIITPAEPKAEEPKIPEPEAEEPESEPEANAQGEAIAKQVAIEVARTAASQADVSSINDKLDQLPQGIFNIDGTAGSGNVPMLGINGTWYYGTVEVDVGLDLGSKVCFGYDIDGTTVTIYSGEIDRIAVSETNVASVADDNYIYVRRTIADDTMLVTKGASVPADDATYKYYKLYQFSVADSLASIKRIWRPFAIEGAESEDKLPAGGDQYQVLQRDGSGDAVWDWVRAHA